MNASTLVMKTTGVSKPQRPNEGTIRIAVMPESPGFNPETKTGIIIPETRTGIITLETRTGIAIPETRAESTKEGAAMRTTAGTHIDQERMETNRGGDKITVTSTLAGVSLRLETAVGMVVKAAETVHIMIETEGIGMKVAWAIGDMLEVEGATIMKDRIKGEPRDMDLSPAAESHGILKDKKGEMASG